MTRKPIDVEKLLEWSFRVELPKGRPVSMSPWETITQFARLGTLIDTSGHGDGLGFVPGTPHADAQLVGAAVRRLPRDYRLGADRVRDVMGDYAALDPDAVTALAGAPFNLSALVIRCAVLGERLPWDAGMPRARPVTWESAQNRPIVFGIGGDGELKVLHLNRRRTYDIESAPRCHVEWHSPTIRALGEVRAEYAAWHDALMMLVRDLAGTLAAHRIMPPLARPAPWQTGQAVRRRPLPVTGAADEVMPMLPLQPKRKAPGAPLKKSLEAMRRDAAA